MQIYQLGEAECRRCLISHGIQTWWMSFELQMHSGRSGFKIIAFRVYCYFSLVLFLEFSSETTCLSIAEALNIDVRMGGRRSHSETRDHRIVQANY